jgi:hypothetical protein
LISPTVIVPASRQHELVAGPDGGFVLKIHDAALAHRQPAPAAKSVAASRAPQVAQASAPLNPAMTPATTPAATTTTVAPAPASAENTAKPATDFAFVEPKFSPKDDKATEPVVPRPRKRPAALPTRRRRNWLPPLPMPHGASGCQQAGHHSRP